MLWKIAGAVLGALILAGLMAAAFGAMVTVAYIAEQYLVPRPWGSGIAALFLLATVGGVLGWRAASEALADESKPRRKRVATR